MKRPSVIHRVYNREKSNIGIIGTLVMPCASLGEAVALAQKEAGPFGAYVVRDNLVARTVVYDTHGESV